MIKVFFQEAVITTKSSADSGMYISPITFNTNNIDPVDSYSVTYDFNDRHNFFLAPMPYFLSDIE